MLAYLNNKIDKGCCEHTGSMTAFFLANWVLIC